MNEEPIIPIEGIDGHEPVALDIVMWPDDILSTKCEDVIDFDDELKNTIVDMFFTMRMSNGIGLAAPQIGKNIRLTVLMLDTPLILINPCIVQMEGSQTTEEGCLSVPGYFTNIKRSEKIRMVYQNESGKQNELSATGFSAVAIQHELDHLDGKVFVDQLSAFKQLRAKQKIKKTLKLRSKIV